MRPFPGPEHAWPGGPFRWQLYVLPDYSDQQLADWIRDTRRVATESLPADRKNAITLVKPQFVHATVHMVHLPAHAVTGEKLTALTNTLVTRLAAIPAFTITAGRASAGNGGVVLDVDGDGEGGPWTELSATAGQAIDEVFGPDARASTPAPPHLSIGYCAEAIDSGIIQSRLRRELRRPPAPFPVTAVHLLRVRQDTQEHSYEWIEHDAVRIPLRQSAAPRRNEGAGGG